MADGEAEHAGFVGAEEDVDAADVRVLRAEGGGPFFDAIADGRARGLALAEGLDGRRGEVGREDDDHGAEAALEAAELGLDPGVVEEDGEDSEDGEDRAAVEKRDADVKALPQAERADRGREGVRAGER
jgi:hypothetical protein